MLTAIHILGQIIFGGYFVWNGVNHFLNHRDYTAYATMNRVPMPGIAIFVTGVLLVAGGLGILFNIQTKLALILLIMFIVPVSFTMHAFWKTDNQADRSSGKIAFMKNMALLGAMLVLF